MQFFPKKPWLKVQNMQHRFLNWKCSENSSVLVASPVPKCVGAYIFLIRILYSDLYKDRITEYIFSFSTYSDVHINKHNAFFQGGSIQICAYKCAYIIWKGYALMKKSAWPALTWIPISINYRWFGGSIASLVFATLVFGCWRIVKAAILQSTVSTRRCNSIMDQCKF